jgi:hypothetical protein
LQKAKNCIKLGVILEVDSFKKLKHNNNLSNFEAIKNMFFLILLLFFFTFKQVKQWGGYFAIPLKVFQHTYYNALEVEKTNEVDYRRVNR